MNVLGLPLPETLDQARAIDAYWQAKAREDFYVYRHYMHPNLLDGWWQREIAAELQAFKDQLLAGEAPILLIQAPPQHGKSMQVVDFVSWLAGHAPHLRSIYTSFSQNLGTRANLALQRLFDSRKYQATFDTRLGERVVTASSGQAVRNRELLEFSGHSGMFRNTTVRGPITGEGLDLGIIDDPIKGREEANSKTIRDKTWDWLTDDFMTRFSESAGVLGIMTRWHIDDPFGRLREANPRARVLSYPAIATRDEEHRKEGEALFPEHKSLDFILRRKQAMAPGNFQALYQQSPVVQGGEIIKEEWLEFYDTLPELSHAFITADTAQKAGPTSDWSVFQLWGRLKSPWSNGNKSAIALVDMIRGRWEYPELKENAIRFAQRHIGEGKVPLRHISVEDKSSGTSLIQDLKRNTDLPIKKIKRGRASKEDRVEDILGHIASGRVILPRNAVFTKDLVSELIQFPNGTHDDQVDPLADAVNIELNQTRSQMSALKPMRATNV